jgi:hypothetical protein
MDIVQNDILLFPCLTAACSIFMNKHTRIFYACELFLTTVKMQKTKFAVDSVTSFLKSDVATNKSCFSPAKFF